MLLALIGRGWLNAVDEHNRRWLDDPDDPDDLIVLEIATALRRNIRVIPVLVEGAAPPRRDDLPGILAPLARRQVVRLDHAGFNATMTTLLAALERALATAHAEADLRGEGLPDVDRTTLSSTSPGRRSMHEWTVDDFTLLLHDRRPSARRIVAVLDALAKQPDTDPALSDLAVSSDTAADFDRQLWNELCSLRFLDNAHGALLLGPVGVRQARRPGSIHIARPRIHVLGGVVSVRSYLIMGSFDRSMLRATATRMMTP